MLSVSNRRYVAEARQGHGVSCAWSYAQDPETTTFGIMRKPEVE